VVFQSGIGNDTPSNTINFYLRDLDGNNIISNTASTYNDGNKHRVVLNKTGNTASDLEIYVDTNQDSEVNTDQDFGNVGDFTLSLYFFARNLDGSADGHLDTDLDGVIIYDSPLTADQIQNDYDRQPWT